MIRDTWEERDREAGHGGTAAVPAEWAATAAELATEFCAPVAIFDPRLQTVVLGGRGRSNRSSPRSTTRSSACAGRTSWPKVDAVTWRRPLDPQAGLALAAGLATGWWPSSAFRHRPTSPPETAEWDETSVEDGGCRREVGPGVCGARSSSVGRTGRRGGCWRERRTDRGGDSGSRTHATEVDKGIAINRLTRRLRISDPPHHFQTVATTVLRTSLNLTAVAWVPRDAHEPVVVSGEIPGLTAQAYRGFPVACRATIRRFCAPMRRRAQARGAPPSVRRYAIGRRGLAGLAAGGQSAR